MRKSEALAMIDLHKNRLIDPIELLNWSWLRVIILNIKDDDWDDLVAEAAVLLSK